MSEFIQDAKANPKTSVAGLGLLAVAGLNLAYVVAVAVIYHTAPDAKALFQDCSIIVGFSVAGVIGLLAKDGNSKLLKFVASHVPEQLQDALVKEGTKIVGEVIETEVSDLEKPKGK